MAGGPSLVVWTDVEACPPENVSRRALRVIASQAASTGTQRLECFTEGISLFY